MTDSKHGITRRDFLSRAAMTAGILYFGGPALFAQAPTKTRVVLIRDPDVLDRLNRPRPDRIAEMLDQGMATLFETPTAHEAWRKILSPEDIVGIKTNEWHFLPTPPEIEQAIRRRVIDVGVPEKRIGLKDRGVLDDPLFREATALINVRPLRTHYWSGVGSLIKNYIPFVPRPSDFHPDTCADLAAIWKRPIVAGKTRLNLLVMLTPLFHGEGPHHFNPKYTWRYGGLLLGTDPVAVDSVGVRILQNKRRDFFGEDRPLNPPPKHIVLADTRHRLGTADPQKIQLICLGWEEDRYL